MERRVRHRDEWSFLTIRRLMPLLLVIAILIFPLFSPSLPISLSQPHFVCLKNMHAFLSVISLYLHLSSFFPTLPFFFPYFPITVLPSFVPSVVPSFVPSFLSFFLLSFLPPFLTYLLIYLLIYLLTYFIHSSIHPFPSIPLFHSIFL